jgi:hypothetical protein
MRRASAYGCHQSDSLVLKLLMHFQSFIERITKTGGSDRTAPQVSRRDSLSLRLGFGAWNENAGDQLNLNCASHNPVGRSNIEIDKRSGMGVLQNWWRYGALGIGHGSLPRF